MDICRIETGRRRGAGRGCFPSDGRRNARQIRFLHALESGRRRADASLRRYRSVHRLRRRRRARRRSRSRPWRFRKLRTVTALNSSPSAASASRSFWPEIAGRASRMRKMRSRCGSIRDGRCRPACRAAHGRARETAGPSCGRWTPRPRNAGPRRGRSCRTPPRPPPPRPAGPHPPRGPACVAAGPPGRPPLRSPVSPSFFLLRRRRRNAQPDCNNWPCPRPLVEKPERGNAPRGRTSPVCCPDDNRPLFSAA